MVIKMMMRFDDMTNMKNHDGYDQDPTVTKSYSKSIYALIVIHSELNKAQQSKKSKKQHKTKQNKAKLSKTKQNKAKQSKTK